MSRSSSLFASTTKLWILAATLPFLGGVLTTSLVASPAVADTIITYTLEGVTAPSFSDSFSGTITYDATTSRTQNVGSIIVTGSTDPGTYTSFGGALSGTLLAFADTSTGIHLDLGFVAAPGNSPDELSALEFTASGFVSATGQIDPTPLPAALPLFASGLGAMGLFGWRRKRKASATASA